MRLRNNFQLIYFFLPHLNEEAVDINQISSLIQIFSEVSIMNSPTIFFIFKIEQFMIFIPIAGINKISKIPQALNYVLCFKTQYKTITILLM